MASNKPASRKNAVYLCKGIVHQTGEFRTLQSELLISLGRVVLISFKRQNVPVTQQIRYLVTLAALLIIIEVANMLSGRALNQFGLLPGTTTGLLGIFSAPFLHGNWAHLLSNLPPLLVFSLLMFQHGRWRMVLASIGIILIGGLLVWQFGRMSFHVGASGVVFGYFGFLLVAGFVSKEFKLLLIAIAVGLLYGGMLWGVLPIKAYVSFESHLFGLLAGAFMAMLIGSAKGKTR